MYEAIKLSAALIEKRDAARLLLGDRYKEIMAEYGEVITTVAGNRKINIVAATMQMIGESPELESMAVLYLVAAAVELIEPSPSEATHG